MNSHSELFKIILRDLLVGSGLFLFIVFCGLTFGPFFGLVFGQIQVFLVALICLICMVVDVIINCYKLITNGGL